MREQAMSEITLTIDGKQVKGQSGDTILQVCERNDVYVPTLCHYHGLHSVGTCRMCIVELQGGVRTTTACTTPAENGMVVGTESPRLSAMRRATLELLFSERNHYCMFCEASGDCELQQLAYRHGMDNVRYPALYPAMPMDSSHPYLVVDHNRCILCRRCVRACGEVVANHNLGMRDRGIETMLVADGGEPMDDSRCVSCGTCLQVCPTGAIFDRRSAYRGRTKDCTVAQSTCPECSLGCQVELVARSGQVLRVDAAPAGDGIGLLCKKGRFESLNGHRERVATPLVRKEGALQPASWDEALDLVRSRMAGIAAAGGAVAGMASARATNETLRALRCYYLQAFDSSGLFAAGADTVAETAPPAGLDDILAADLIVLGGSEVGAGHQVVEFAVGRAVEQNGAALVVIGSADKRLLKRAKAHVEAQDVNEPLAGTKAAGNAAATAIAEAQRPVFVLGPEVPDTAIASLAASAEEGWPRVLRLGRKANSRGAAAAGLPANGVDLAAARAAIIVAGDDVEMLDRALSARYGLEFLAVLASYQSPLTELADVVLPAPVWTEKQGTLVSSQGRQVALQAAVSPPAGVRDEVEVLAALAGR